MNSKNQMTAAAMLLAVSALVQADDAPPPATTQLPNMTIKETVEETYAASKATTATKTDTPLIDVPQSVQVITHKLIEEQDVRTLADALVNVSGVIPTKPEEALFTAPIVRGFPAEIYLDGLPMYGATEAADDPDSLVGVQRIEVLKGPTSTLYGGGLGSPLGGLINIVSERPDDTLGGFVALRAGSFSTWDPYVDVNLPLASGIDARLAAEYQKSGSWIDLVGGDRWSVKPSLSFKIDSKTDLLLQGQINHRSQLEYSGLPAAQAITGQLDRNAYPGAPIGQPRTTIDTHSATVVLSHDFTGDLRLNVSGRYYDSTNPEYGSFVYPQLYPPDPATPTAYPILPLDGLTTVREATFDANAAAKVDLLGGHHEFLEGVDYDHIRFAGDLGFNGIPVGVQDLASPVYNLAFGPYTPINLTQTDRYQTIAGYVQDQAGYGPFHLTGSLRYTQLEFLETEQGTNQTFHHVSPRIGATFDLVDGIAVFAGYATTFRAPFALTSLQPPKPETSRNVEGGLKLELPRVGLSGTFAVFDQTHDNVPTPAPPPNMFFSEQQGQQRARGVEADVTWEPTSVISLIANYAYTHARVTQDDNIPSQVGDKLPRVPNNSGRIAARYRVQTGVAKGLSFGAGITASSSRPLTLPNSVSVPGYVAADAQAAYEFGRFTVQFSGVNLAGRRAFDPYEYLGFPVVLPNQPRSAYVTLKIRL